MHRKYSQKSEPPILHTHRQKQPIRARSAQVSILQGRKRQSRIETPTLCSSTGEERCVGDIVLEILNIGVYKCGAGQVKEYIQFVGKQHGPHEYLDQKYSSAETYPQYNNQQSDSQYLIVTQRGDGIHKSSQSIGGERLQVKYQFCLKHIFPLLF
jgi:hypothetical protein